MVQSGVHWYTSIALTAFLCEKYRWLFVGTIMPTDKKDRKGDDPPFLKLSNGALKYVKRGWYREAVIEKKTTSCSKYKIQCSTWRDKKQVMFIHTKCVGSSNGYTVQRHQKGSARRITIETPLVRNKYADHYNAVDKNDRDSTDYSTTIRTTRYYLRIFFWILDRVVYTCYVVVCSLANANRK